MYNPTRLDIPGISLARTTGRAPHAPAAARLCFVGDLMLGRRVSAEFGRRAPADFWDDTLPLLTSADAVIGNLESPITEHGGRWSEEWKAFRFAAHPDAVELLRAANIRAVNLANNHILDCEAKGLQDTIGHLDGAGICHAGAGLDLGEAWSPKLFRAGPLTVGFIGVTDNMRGFAARQDRAGSSYLAINTEPATVALMERLVRNLRDAGAATVVLSVHWGPNLRPWPPKRFRQFARAAIRAGVDVVHGHSAHLIQGVETFEQGVILYDTGDFLDDYWVFPGIRIDHSFVFEVEYRDSRPLCLNMVPVKLTPGRVSLARETDFAHITGRMLRKSRQLGTVLRETEAGLALDVGPLAARHQSRTAAALSRANRMNEHLFKIGARPC